MADLKISQLSAATALAGTEVIPVVQSGGTKKATVDQILSPASGKGINFAAAGGDVLTMYDEGTFTPTVAGATTAGTTTYVAQAGHYTRIGRVVMFRLYVEWSGQTGSGNLLVGGLPFNSALTYYATACSVFASNLTFTANASISGSIVDNGSTITIVESVNGAPFGTVQVDVAGALTISGMYFV